MPPEKDVLVLAVVGTSRHSKASHAFTATELCYVMFVVVLWYSVSYDVVSTKGLRGGKASDMGTSYDVGTCRRPTVDALRRGRPCACGGGHITTFRCKLGLHGYTAVL
jgi:hypothetical protein